MKGLLLAILIALAAPVQAREFISSITEGDEIAALRPEFKVPNEPNQLFYIQRSSNANTVVYAANLDARGDFDSRNPVDVFWRMFNIDGHKQPLNFMERIMAYGVHVDTGAEKTPISFSIVALPDRKLTLAFDAQHQPQALLHIGAHTVKLVYVYLHVVETGILPSVPALDIFGTDIATGKAVHEHLIQR